MTGYYDAVLGLIPLALLGGSSTLYLSGLGSTMAVTIASLFTVALMGHALFVNGPIDDVPTTPEPQSASQSPSGPQFQQAD